MRSDRIERLAPDRARCLPVGEGPSFLAVERTERHALMGVTSSVFRRDAGGPPGDARIRLAPSRTYVRLSAGQRDALVETFAAVDRVLP